VKLARMTVTVCAGLAPAGILAFFWSHRENSKFLWTIKKYFYRSFNAIFGKIGRLASEEVIVHLISVICLPVLMYGLDACPCSLCERQTFIGLYHHENIYENFSD